MKRFIFYLHFVVILLLFSDYLQAQSKHIKKVLSTHFLIPVGWDAYRMWDQLPMQRIGVRAYMRSTYDRNGGNHGADASHFLFANEQDQNVTLDLKGTGVLYFFRANHWHGSPWHFEIDDKDNVVKETATTDPVNAIRTAQHTEFIPAGPFAQPLAWTWATTKGADLIWSPLPFREALRIAYSHTFYGTGYYIYHLFANKNELSKPIESFDIKRAPDKDVVNLINAAGTDIAPKGINKIQGKLKLNKPRVTVATIKAQASSIRAIKFTMPIDKAADLERIRLQVTWDDSKHPSIDAPLCLFFGAGTLYNRESREYLVKGFPLNIRYDYPNKQVELSCYYAMPFFRSAKVELSDINPGNAEIRYEVRYEPLHVTAYNNSSYFHATYKDIPEPELGKDMTYLDTRGAEGHEEWSGNFVGTSFVFSHGANLGTLEGDPRFFFDDSDTPQAYGTGTEEWAGGGDYWGGQNMTLPFAGHPCGAPNKEKATCEKDLIESGYRFLIADLMPFGHRAVIKFEHGGENLAAEHYEAVTYWYGLPAPSLVKTDEIDIGDIPGEKKHDYFSPAASTVLSLTSRYELGIDTFPKHPWGMEAEKIFKYKEKMGQEVYPARTLKGRITQGSSEFNVRLSPKNKGVLIRRTLDYGFPNQTAEVYIKDIRSSSSIGKWKKAGIWYLAGANTAIFSSPKGELDDRKIVVETSDRRFRDDEFLIPAELTKGRSTVRVKIKFIPNHQALYPGYLFPNASCWSELKYDVYSYILPKFKVGDL